MRVVALTASIKGLCDVDASQSILQSEKDVIVIDEDNCTVKTHLADAFAIPKSVRFDTVKIHKHAIIPGYNPGGTLGGGPPLDIDWLELNTEMFPLDEFEAMRGPRRDAHALQRTKEDRWQVLLGQGFSQEAIQLAEDLAETIRLQRQISALDLPIEEAVCSSHAKKFRKETNVTNPDTVCSFPRQKKHIGLRGLFWLKRHR